MYLLLLSIFSCLCYLFRLLFILLYLSLFISYVMFCCFCYFFFFFFFKQKTAYEMLRSLVGSEMCIRDSSISLSLSLVLVTASLATGLKPCPGDTRGDGRCNHDRTHRVCAEIGRSPTSFFTFTGQRPWCGTADGGRVRCPPEAPSWCICKWATARWIDQEGCNDTVRIDCDATDICDLKNSFTDGNVNLKPAHDCVAKKCQVQWQAC
eukprot:TRINITY_DN45031_c0_g2_i1.p1 TRINITY_DN45031_c0_g2~~TRINITY_DN45031_c0_g2_i1.p1  ORF type:complete len:208 (-),score=46.43 TRINITY_DN45031_c0_g2_i1:237-860(-)